MSASSLKQKKTTEENGQIEEKEEKKQPKRKRVKRHAFPIWLRILVVFALLIICIVVGLIVGYGIIGDGEPLDALKKQTWQHIFDIISKD